MPFREKIFLGDEQYTVVGAVHRGACSDGDAEHTVFFDAVSVEIEAVMNTRGDVLSIPQDHMREICDILSSLYRA